MMVDRGIILAFMASWTIQRYFDILFPRETKLCLVWGFSSHAWVPEITSDLSPFSRIFMIPKCHSMRFTWCSLLLTYDVPILFPYDSPQWWDSHDVPIFCFIIVLGQISTTEHSPWRSIPMLWRFLDISKKSGVADVIPRGHGQLFFFSKLRLKFWGEAANTLDLWLCIFLK